jgi:hypothetical protein
MKITTGRVVSGKIEFEADLQEGIPVAILSADESKAVLTAEDEEELLTALDDIRHGRYVDGRELLRELKDLSRR